MRKTCVLFAFLFWGQGFCFSGEQDLVTGLGVILSAENDVHLLANEPLSWFLVVEVKEVYCGTIEEKKILIGFNARWDDETSEIIGIPGVRRNGTLDPKVWKPGQLVVFHGKRWRKDQSSCGPETQIRYDEDVFKESFDLRDFFLKRPEDWIQQVPWANPNLEKYRPIPIFCIEGGDNLMLIYPFPKKKVKKY